MSTADPLATAVADFRTAWGAYCALPDDQCTPETEQAWRAAWARFLSAPTPSTREGALAALSFVLDDTVSDIEPEHRGLLEAVGRYLSAA